MRTEPMDYGTRWNRAGAAMLAAVLISATLGVAMVKGAIATTFIATSGAGALSTSALKATGVGAVVMPVPAKQPDGTVTQPSVARFGIQRATVNGLCLAEQQKVLGATVTLLVTAGDQDPSTDEIQIDGALLDAFVANADIGLRGTAEINKNGSSVTVPGSPITIGGATDNFGLQAPAAELKQVTAQIQSITVPTGLHTPDITIRLVPGAQGCPPPAPPAK